MSLPTVSEYFSLAIRLLIAFGVIFEMPVLMVFLAKVGVVNLGMLNRHRKYAILINFIVAAILTPTPDIVNQLMMAVPLMVLYEISIVAVWLFGRKGFADFQPGAVVAEDEAAPEKAGTTSDSLFKKD